jgi:hypothetical protein
LIAAARHVLSSSSPGLTVIHVLLFAHEDVDGRVKPGHDD